MSRWACTIWSRRVDPSEGNGGLAAGDGVEEVLEDRRGKVCRFAGVGREPDPVGQPVHRVEAVDGPVIRQHPGEADGSAWQGRSQGVLQDVGTDEFGGPVGTGRGRCRGAGTGWP